MSQTHRTIWRYYGDLGVHPDDCPALARFGKYLLAIVKYRRGVIFGRTRTFIGCYRCDLRVNEP